MSAGRGRGAPPTSRLPQNAPHRHGDASPGDGRRRGSAMSKYDCAVQHYLPDCFPSQKPWFINIANARGWQRCGFLLCSTIRKRRPSRPGDWRDCFHDALHRQSGLRTLRKGWPAAVKREHRRVPAQGMSPRLCQPISPRQCGGAITRCPRVVTLAHYYCTEIQRMADKVGDSLELSLYARDARLTSLCLPVCASWRNRQDSQPASASHPADAGSTCSLVTQTDVAALRLA